MLTDLAILLQMKLMSDFQSITSTLINQTNQLITSIHKYKVTFQRSRMQVNVYIYRYM